MAVLAVAALIVRAAIRMRIHVESAPLLWHLMMWCGRCLCCLSVVGCSRWSTPLSIFFCSLVGMCRVYFRKWPANWKLFFPSCWWISQWCCVSLANDALTSNWHFNHARCHRMRVLRTTTIIFTLIDEFFEFWHDLILSDYLIQTKHDSTAIRTITHTNTHKHWWFQRFDWLCR